MITSGSRCQTTVDDPEDQVQAERQQASTRQQGPVDHRLQQIDVEDAHAPGPVLAQTPRRASRMVAAVAQLGGGAGRADAARLEHVGPMTIRSNLLHVLARR